MYVVYYTLHDIIWKLLLRERKKILNLKLLGLLIKTPKISYLYFIFLANETT